MYRLPPLPSRRKGSQAGAQAHRNSLAVTQIRLWRHFVSLQNALGPKERDDTDQSDVTKGAPEQAGHIVPFAVTLTRHTTCRRPLCPYLPCVNECLVLAIRYLVLLSSLLLHSSSVQAVHYHRPVFQED